MATPTPENIGIWGRVGHLTQTQAAALLELQKQQPGLGDREALRYLRARAFCAEKAAQLYLDSREWRRTNKPWALPIAQVRPYFEKGAFSLCPRLDKKERPVMIIDPSAHDPSDTDSLLKAFQFTLEASIARLKPDVDDGVFLFDLRNYSLLNSDSRAAIGIIKSLQTGYPERMAMAILYCPPRVFFLLWKVIRFVIDPRVHAKIHFVYTKEELEPLIGVATLPASFEGSGKFDLDAWCKDMSGFTPVGFE